MARILGPGAAGDINKPDDAKAATPGATPPAGGSGTGTGTGTGDTGTGDAGTGGTGTP